MSEKEDTTAARVLIVPLRGKDSGQFGWCLRTDDFLLRCLKKFPSREAAERDASEFAEAPLQKVH